MFATRSAHPAVVYVPIPGKRAGAGKVTFRLQNRLVEYQAVTEDDTRLTTGEKVIVVAAREFGYGACGACGTYNQRRGAAGRSLGVERFNGTEIKLMQFACRISAEGGEP